MAFSLSAATRRMSMRFGLLLSTSSRRSGVAAVVSGGSTSSFHRSGEEVRARRSYHNVVTAAATAADLLLLQDRNNKNRNDSIYGGGRRGFSDHNVSSTTNTNTTGIEPTLAQPTLHKAADGRQFAAFELPKFHQKLKPYIVKRRLNRMKTYVGEEKAIRGSPWKLNLVCQLAAGLTLNDALQQLDFCDKRVAPLVQKVLKRTANLAELKDGLQRSQLEVAECFATKGSSLKRAMLMGRGRTGKMEHRYSHFRVVLREIDYKLRIYQAPSINQKKKWFVRQQEAEVDAQKAAVERAEMAELKRQAEANRAKRQAEEAGRK
jgi:large subunit ribosomal protein L22